MSLKSCVYRKVKNDSAVSVNNTLYECPPEFIGKKIEIRYHSDKSENLTIYEDNKPVFQLKKVNIHENAINALYQNAGGIPRIINKLSLKSMTIGAIEKKDILTEEDVYRASQEL